MTALGLAAPARLALAAAPIDNRLAIVILRGGLDGLHAAPPHGDPRYRELRPNIAVPAPGEPGGALDLDGYFGLHPALAPLLEMYQAGQMLILPAATTSYRARSHFDGQNLLENGTMQPHGATDGWLNRAIVHLNGGDRRLGLALGHALPLILRGPANVPTWAPTSFPEADEDLLSRLAYIYANDPLFAAALAEARRSKLATAGMNMGAQPRRRGQFKFLAEAAGKLMSASDGPRIAAFESTGWDTHFRQVDRLGVQLHDLAEGLAAFRARLGPAWDRTAVAVVSEFGRTAAENGSRGTDHGVGGIAFVLGGAVRGGRIAGTWPGLSAAALYQNRDLAPANNYWSLFKTLLRGHAGLSEAAIEEAVFPGSRAIRPMRDILL